MTSSDRCKRGHARTPANTYWYEPKPGSNKARFRTCRDCRREGRPRVTAAEGRQPVGAQMESLLPHLERFKSLFAEGVPMTWVAEDYGVSLDSVYTFARRHGIVHSDPRGLARVWGAVRRDSALSKLYREFAPGLSVKAVHA